jgi:RsiW-degrading membrane proteinase PrsW (M82 family)
VVTYATANVLLVSTLVLLRSFLVPVTFVTWAFERGRSYEITTQLLFRMFVVGGVLGVLAASPAESYLLRPSWWMLVCGPRSSAHRCSPAAAATGSW